MVHLELGVALAGSFAGTELNININLTEEKKSWRWASSSLNSQSKQTTTVSKICVNKIKVKKYDIIRNIYITELKKLKSGNWTLNVWRLLKLHFCLILFQWVNLCKAVIQFQLLFITTWDNNEENPSELLLKLNSSADLSCQPRKTQNGGNYWIITYLKEVVYYFHWF